MTEENKEQPDICNECNKMIYAPKRDECFYRLRIKGEYQGNPVRIDGQLVYECLKNVNNLSTKSIGG